MNSDLYQFSINQLALNKGRWPEIARDCKVSYSWLCKFANNEIPNASYVKVTRIAEHLQAGEKRENKSRRKQDRRVH